MLFKNENIICANCRHELPLTHYHKIKENPIEKIFYGRVVIENATAFLNFEKKNITQTLIHQLKYKGHQKIGAMLGTWMATDLKKDSKYQDIDIVIPVPLHKKKYHKRGYNQVSLFAKSLALGLDAHFDENVLLRIHNTKAQTFKNRVMRGTNDHTIFSLVDHEKLNNKHILLVDDVVTTGATIEACVKKLQIVTNIKISIATMALTQ